MEKITNRSILGIKINEDFATIKLSGVRGELTKFVWNDMVVEYSLEERIMHGLWLSLIRDAFINGRSDVNVTFNRANNLISEIELGIVGV